jgi:hypothetical protein
VRGIARGNLRIGFCRRGAVGPGQCGQQAFLDRGPEALHLVVGFFHELGLQRRIEIGLHPELMPLVIFLLELCKPVAMRRKPARIVQHKRRLKIGFDHVFRWRQDVGNEVIAKL